MNESVKSFELDNVAENTSREARRRGTHIQSKTRNWDCKPVYTCYIFLVFGLVATCLCVILAKPLFVSWDPKDWPQEHPFEHHPVSWYIPRAADIPALDQASRCPVWPALNSSISVSYDFRNPQNMATKIARFKNGKTEIISEYDDAVKIHAGEGKRKRRNVEIREERVIGGRPTNIKEYPFYVSLHSHSHDQHLCGGSIISESWVLSAAHCFEELPSIYAWIVHVGISASEELHSDYDFSHQSNVQAILLHPKWNKKTFQADLALLKLQNPIPKFTDFIQPHCIPFSNSHAPEIDVGETVTLNGFGYTDEDEIQPSPMLRSVDLTLFRNADCNRLFKKKWVKQGMICAGELHGGKDACQGDSGGPLSYKAFFEGDSIWWLKGVVSFGVGCGRKNLGGVYASVKYYADWIAYAAQHYDNFIQKIPSRK